MAFRAGGKSFTIYIFPLNMEKTNYLFECRTCSCPFRCASIKNQKINNNVTSDKRNDGIETYDNGVYSVLTVERHYRVPSTIDHAHTERSGTRRTNIIR